MILKIVEVNILSQSHKTVPSVIQTTTRRDVLTLILLLFYISIFLYYLHLLLDKI